MNFHLEYIDNTAIISSISYESPLQDLIEIAYKLKEKHYIGNVVFDLLCSNGTESNRFVLMAFDGLSFDRRSLRLLPNPDKELLLSQSRFYKSNKNAVMNSVLSSNSRTQFF